ncbi:MAG TPA: arylesterase [Longimicrobium sp.]|nr:arylesterase [Longimicrobium sp.]
MSTRSVWLKILVPTLFIIGCQADERNSAPPAGDAANPPLTAGSPDAARGASGDRKVVLFVGTSLTAALGLEPEQGFPARVQEKIDSAGLPFEVVNAGVSGETSTGARARIGWLLNQPFDVLVLETGANDMLRGTRLDRLRGNIEAIVDTVRQVRPDARIVLTGMLASPNLGADYGRDFRAVYTEVARADSLPLVPFLLEGVAAVPELNLGDGIHPNERGHRVVADNVWKVLEPVLREEAAEQPARDAA